MSKLLLVYYSRTGNTQKMAEAIAKGVESVPGVDVKMMVDFEVTPEDLVEADGIIVGVPTYHHDMTRGIKALFEEAADNTLNLRGKVGASFGSYGWSAEAPRLVNEIMEHKFVMNVIKPPLLVKYAPNEANLEECRRFGKKIAEHIKTN